MNKEAITTALWETNAVMNDSLDDKDFFSLLYETRDILRSLLLTFEKNDAVQN